MDKKEKLEDLLDSLSPEQIEELQSLLQKSSVTSRDTKKKKRRGKRRRKRREAAKARENQVKKEKEPQKNSSSVEDFLVGITLTQQEREQLEEASQADKEGGAHDPREQTSIPKKKVDTRIDMRCRICGKTERVSRSLVPPEPNRFKCNECCCQAG